MERVSYDRRKELAADLRTIFDASNRELAMTLAEKLAAKWRKEGYKKVADHLEEHVEECLSCLAFPESHRKRIRSTNGLERVNQEIRRRSRVVRIFPNRASCLRLVTAVVAEISEEWVTGKRYLDMAELELHREQEVTMS
jgi:putative transposase